MTSLVEPLHGIYFVGNPANCLAIEHGRVYPGYVQGSNIKSCFLRQTRVIVHQRSNQREGNVEIRVLKSACAIVFVLLACAPACSPRRSDPSRESSSIQPAQ